MTSATSPNPEPPIAQALILAGGQATRLRPYTDTRPKAMVEVAGRPIIDHQLEWLPPPRKAEVLRDHLEARSEGPEITLLVEDEPLGRGGALRYAATGLRDAESPYFALNGDVLTWFDLTELTAHHRAKGGLATLALARFRTTWGVVDIDDEDRVEGFTQSPLLPVWINAGVYLFEPGITPLLPAKGDHESSTFPELAGEGKLTAYRIDGFWRGVDTAKDVKEAGEEIAALRSTV
ncbi:nucleotidyltransferase family protein [Nocardiopsis salina]|uniref:nucleotidyltransferase family protein n=1 Tax=Nocardiopsis salina TaxID=245836 RepID=UPI000382233E|nr:nucleotidyltransferase family protein [Nocardiopsis salina]